MTLYVNSGLHNNQFHPTYSKVETGLHAHSKGFSSKVAAGEQLGYILACKRATLLGEEPREPADTNKGLGWIDQLVGLSALRGEAPGQSS